MQCLNGGGADNAVSFQAAACLEGTHNIAQGFTVVLGLLRRLRQQLGRHQVIHQQGHVRAALQRLEQFGDPGHRRRWLREQPLVLRLQRTIGRVLRLAFGHHLVDCLGRGLKPGGQQFAALEGNKPLRLGGGRIEPAIAQMAQEQQQPVGQQQLQIHLATGRILHHH